MLVNRESVNLLLFVEPWQITIGHWERDSNLGPPERDLSPNAQLLGQAAELK